MERQTWYGSLIEEKTDDSGLMYMRNRYYNPATGIFTQEDPIGIAGGLNTYGFAGSDPATYSDPFGLCPEKKRNDKGECPGGLSPEQWRKVEAGIRGVRSASDRRVLTRRLQLGEIRAGNLGEGALGAVRPIMHQVIWLNENSGSSAFSLSTNDLAFVLAEELHHTRQFAPRTFGMNNLSLVGNILMNAVFAFVLGGYERNPIENRAHAYACSVTSGVPGSTPVRTYYCGY